MRVVTITHWPPRRSGLASYSMKLCHELAKYVNVTVMSNKDPSHGSALENNVTKRSLRVIRAWTPGPFAIIQSLKNVARTYGDLYHIQFEYALFGDSLCTLLLPVLVLLLRLKRRPILLTLHGVISKTMIRHPKDVTSDNTYLRMFQRVGLGIIPLLAIGFVTKLMCLLSSKIIVHNDLMKQVLIIEYQTDTEKISVIPHGVDKCEHICKLTKKRGTKNIILFFGFLRPSKGIEYLIEAMSTILERIPNAKLVIAGGAPHQQRDMMYITQLRVKAKRLGYTEHIEFIEGFLPEWKIKQLISSSDVIVFPYIDRFIEASGVLCNVMDYSKSIVCSRTPRFLGELNHGIDCIMVAPQDAKDLARGISLLLEDEGLRCKIGENLRRRARSRYWNLVAKKHLTLYWDVIKQ